MKVLTILTALGLLCAVPLAAQPLPQTPTEVWSLNECIDYALKNNIDIQQRGVTTEKSRVNLKTAQYSRLPDLNASLGSNVAFGRSTGSDNTSVSNNQISGSLGVSASLPVFEGLRINKQIKGSQLDLEAAMQDLERAREDVSVNIMTLYLQVLFNQEIVGVSEQQLALSTSQCERSRELVAAGRQPESAYYESEALRANDEMMLTQSRNDLMLSLLNLSQALNRPSAAGFGIVTPQFDSLTIESLYRLGSPDAVYSYAEANRPHIRAELLRLESSRNAVGIAKSSLYPSISLSGGYGTNVFDSSTASFWTQIRNYSSEYVGLSMQIPIFNRRATRNNIRTAKLSLQSQSLALTEAQQSLRKEIEQAYYTAEAAYAKYRSSDKALASAREAFRYEEQRASAGRSTIFDYNDAKTRMEKAESDLIQAKFEFIFRSKILDYYRGEPLTL